MSYILDYSYSIQYFWQHLIDFYVDPNGAVIQDHSQNVSFLIPNVWIYVRKELQNRQTSFICDIKIYNNLKNNNLFTMKRCHITWDMMKCECHQGTRALYTSGAMIKCSLSNRWSDLIFHYLRIFYKAVCYCLSRVCSFHVG